MRYLFSDVKKDLKKKMVFISGPRQVGKTTLALNFLRPSIPKNPSYLNWDITEHRRKIVRNEIPLKESV